MDPDALRSLLVGLGHVVRVRRLLARVWHRRAFGLLVAIVVALLRFLHRSSSQSHHRYSVPLDSSSCASARTELVPWSTMSGSKRTIDRASASASCPRGGEVNRPST